MKGVGPFAKYPRSKQWLRLKQEAYERALKGIGPTESERFFFGTRSLEEMQKLWGQFNTMLKQVYTPSRLEKLIPQSFPLFSMLTKKEWK